jgi:hypothetical protein
MSVRFDANEPYTATTGIPTPPFTVTLWGKIAVDRNDYSMFVAIDKNDITNGYLLGTDSDGITFGLFSAVNDILGSALTVGTWYRLAVVVNGTTTTLYQATATGAVTPTSGTSTTTFTPTRFRIGADAFTGGEFLNGNVANVKVYSAALTQAEIITEWGSWQAQRTANLLRHHKFQTAAETTDYSGNSFALTASGTPTFDADNPNLTATVTATAALSGSGSLAGLTASATRMSATALTGAGGMTPLPTRSPSCPRWS